MRRFEVIWIIASLNSMFAPRLIIYQEECRSRMPENLGMPIAARITEIGEGIDRSDVREMKARSAAK